MVRLRFMLSIATLLGACSSSQAAGQPLKLCFDDIAQAPWTLPNGTGLNIDLLKRVEKKLGERFIFMSRPWKRCVEETRNGFVDGMLGGADSPERRTFSQGPLLPGGQSDPDSALYHDSYFVFVRTGSGVTWNGKQFTNLKNAVVVQRGYNIAEDLRAQGYAVQDVVHTPDEGLRMLAAKAADVAVLLGVEAPIILRKDARFKGRVYQAKLPYSTIPLHLLVSRKRYAADPKRIEAVWRAIREVRASPEYRRLEDAATKEAQ
jgi:polar amino acid transport system substrate-binding protein